MEMTDMEGNLVYVLGRQDPIISVTASRNISNFNIDKKEPSFSVAVEKGLCSITVGSSCTPLVYAVNGQFEIYLPASETIKFITDGDSWKDVSEYQYEVVFENTNTNETYRTLQGFVEVSPSVIDDND